MVHTYIQAILIQILYGGISILLCISNAFSQPKGLNICIDTSNKYSNFNMSGYYLNYTVIDIGDTTMRDSYSRYNKEVFDTIIGIKIFYPNGFCVSVNTISDTLGNFLNSNRLNGRLVKSDTHLVNTYFRYIKSNVNAKKYYKYGNGAGVYKICNDTLFEQSMVNGNSMFLTFNAGESIYVIKNEYELICIGGKTLDSKKIHWFDSSWIKHYTFVPCEYLPPLDTWLQEKKWIYCNKKNKKRKCSCN